MSKTILKLKKSHFNKIYWPLISDKSRYEVMYGGAASGKSFFVAQKIVYRVLVESNHKFLIIRKVGTTLRHSVFEEIKKAISNWNVEHMFTINKTEMTITCANGNQIVFKGLDDPVKLKSIQGVTGIWIEEAAEITQKDFQELDRRMRGRNKHNKQIIITFNPVSASHWLKSYFFDRKIESCSITKSTYLDNKFVDKGTLIALQTLKETDPEEYEVYALGNWGTTDKTLLPKSFIFLQEEKYAMDPLPLQDEYEEIKVWAEPITNVEYVATIDPSRGTGNDNHVMQIWTREGEQVLEFAINDLPTEFFARKCDELMRKYNDAFCIVENNMGDLVLHILINERMYPNIYFSFNTGRAGFETTKTTKPIMIADLSDALREESIKVRSRDCLEEMKVFIRKENGKMEGADGCKDDRVIAASLFLQAIKAYGGLAGYSNNSAL
ncbi:PBSX family phage terminase large subunit [Brevibacillus agri]|uniref:PBSX family phage terminase large subunit n=1 Tax=Brevibacillus agri TaxID=51101 RepID=UPI0025B68AF6|nr:PBSX family phage terminase large subunit [Brevibacillus agri]MDN4094357.1 PBSX family phage terminase large subunit [Brevibacillus agri]